MRLAGLILFDDKGLRYFAPLTPMTRYLLDCDCGNKVPVEIGQAGGRITCSCGAQLDVPPLRKLRHLPPVVVEEHRPAPRWGVRQGVMTASLIVAAVLAAAGIWSWASQPSVPTFDPAMYHRDIEHRLSTMTPAESWLWWIEYYRPLAERGFPVFEAANRVEIEQQIAHRHVVRRGLWIAAGIFAATAAAAAFWPTTAQARRQQANETGRLR